MNKTFVGARDGFTGEPRTLAVCDGAIAASPRGERVDLSGKYVLPAFIDNHCHILPTGLDLAKLHLGHCTTKDEILEALRERANDLAPGEWLRAVHYDQNRLPNSEHMTAAEIDAAISDRPVLLRHWNGHAGVANSAALQAAKVDRATRDPKGGTFLRDASGNPNGVLLETALERVDSAAPDPNLEEMVEAIIAAGSKMAELGIACATDMMTGFIDLATELDAYRIALERGCPIRIRLFLQWSAVFGPRAVPRERLQHFAQRVPADRGKIAGIKIFADGAIGSATAAIHGKFLTTGGNGLLIYAPDRLKEMVRVAHEAGYPLAIHSIGDRSTDLVMDAYEATDEPSRHRVEHAMILSDAQIERLAKLGCHVTMQPEFLLRFGYAYQKQLPPEIFRELKRFRSVMEAGVPLSFSSDRPIVAGDPWDAVRVVEKRPPEFVASEALDRRQALLGYTQGGSDGNFDSPRMGALREGQLADFAVYNEDPLKSASPKVAGLYVGGELVK